VNKVALGQVFSEYFGFPCQSLFHQFLHNQHHILSGAGKIASSGRSTHSPTAQIKKKKVLVLLLQKLFKFFFITFCLFAGAVSFENI
jgi:hypothetical protein